MVLFHKWKEFQYLTLNVQAWSHVQQPSRVAITVSSRGFPNLRARKQVLPCSRILFLGLVQLAETQLELLKRNPSYELREPKLELTPCVMSELLELPLDNMYCVARGCRMHTYPPLRSILLFYLVRCTIY